MDPSPKSTPVPFPDLTKAHIQWQRAKRIATHAWNDYWSLHPMDPDFLSPDDQMRLWGRFLDDAVEIVVFEDHPSEKA